MLYVIYLHKTEQQQQQQKPQKTVKEKTAPKLSGHKRHEPAFLLEVSTSTASQAETQPKTGIFI